MAENAPSVLIALQCAELDNGVSQVLLNLLPRLQRLGISLHVVFPENGSLERALNAKGIKTLVEHAPVFPGRNALGIHRYASYQHDRAVRIADYIHSHGIGLVNTHTFIHWDSAYAARLAGVPHLWSLHNLFGLGAECCLFRLLPWTNKQRMALLDLMGDAYISVSKEVAETLISSECQRPNQVIVNRLDLAGFENRALGIEDSLNLREHLGLAGDAIIVGNVGRIDPVKDQMTFVEVAAMICEKYTKVHFVLVGPVNNQTLYESLCQRVEVLGLIDRVHFVGSVENTAPLYEQFDLFLLTSWCEGLSLAVMEAMAAGCAVIATDGGGVKELLEDQVSGLIAQPKAVSQIAGLVESLLASEELRIRLGKAAQLWIRQHGGWEVAAQEYYKIYQSMALLQGSQCKLGNIQPHSKLSELQGQLTLIARCAALEAKNREVEQELKAQQRQSKQLEEKFLYQLYKLGQRFLSLPHRNSAQRNRSK